MKTHLISSDSVQFTHVGTMHAENDRRSTRFLKHKIITGKRRRGDCVTDLTHNLLTAPRIAPLKVVTFVGATIEVEVASDLG